LRSVWTLNATPARVRWRFDAVGLLCALHGSAGAQTVVFEDNFERESLGLNITSLTNWTVTAGNVDVIGSGFEDIYPGNGNYLDMDGTWGNATIQSTSISLVPGTYQMSFRSRSFHRDTRWRVCRPQGQRGPDDVV
jgi:hypothetical protein